MEAWLVGCKAGRLAGVVWTGAGARRVSSLQDLDWAACARSPLGQPGNAEPPRQLQRVRRAAAQVLVRLHLVLKALHLGSA